MPRLLGALGQAVFHQFVEGGIVADDEHSHRVVVTHRLGEIQLDGQGGRNAASR